MALILNYTTSASNVIGACWRKVCCEHCGSSYVFHVQVKVRTPEARRFSLRSRNALERISPNTERHVAYVLRQRIEPVPCPSCWRYQPEMCEAIRREKLGWIKTATIILLTFSGWGMWLSFSNPISSQPLPANEVPVLRAITLALAAVSLTLLIFFRKIWATYDANTRMPQEARRELAERRALTDADFAARHPGVEAIERERRFGETR